MGTDNVSGLSHLKHRRLSNILIIVIIRMISYNTTRKADSEGSKFQCLFHEPTTEME